LDEGGKAKALMATLQSQGSVSYITPSSEKLPLILRPSSQVARDGDLPSDIKIAIDAPKDIAPNTPVTVQVGAKGGNILDARVEKINADQLPQTVFFDISDKLKNNITRFAIAGRKGAGRSYILDDQFKKRDIGIASMNNDENAAPLIEASYYIRRATEPFGSITMGSISDLLDAKSSVIIMPDVAAMPTEILNKLKTWVENGGVLLRFAGPNMAGSTQAQVLVPVPLRSGGRALSGSLSWDKPQVIAPFTAESPFYGLEIPPEVTIKQQVLADPTQDTEGKVWARLEDGTPFITASRMDKGLIVLVHTTANTDWSDFALSGLYVNVLKRIVNMGGSASC
jgi:hypothetical protein